MMEQKKSCELCGRLARMFCESDQASLCWVCDERVHSANFLVEKHSRTLLCHVCQSPTPWSAAGPKLCTTISVCERCFDSHGKDSQVGHQEVVEDEEYSVNGGGEEDDEFEDEEGMDDDDSEDVEEEEEEEEEQEEEEEEEEEEEDGENQVVPWSCDSPPPPAASSSSSGEESAPAAVGGGLGLGAKRVWDSAFSNESDDEIGCASSQGISTTLADADEAPSSASFHQSKQHDEGNRSTRTAADESTGVESKSTSAAIIHSLRRLQRNPMSEDSSVALVLGICRRSRC